MFRPSTRFRGSAGCALGAGLLLLLIGATTAQRIAGGVLVTYAALVFVLILTLPRIRLLLDPELRRWQRLDATAARLHAKDDFAAAEPHYLEALAAAETSGRPELLGSAANNLAGLYADQGRLLESERLYQRALEVREHGKDDQATAVTLDGLADIQLRLGRSDDAVETSERWLELLRQSVRRRLGRHVNRAYAGALDHHADFLERAGRPADASAIRARAVAMRAGKAVEEKDRPA